MQGPGGNDKEGYSYAKSSFDTVGVATTAVGPRGAIYAINASFSASVGLPAHLTEAKLGEKVAELAAEIQKAWIAPSP